MFIWYHLSYGFTLTLHATIYKHRMFDTLMTTSKKITMKAQIVSHHANILWITATTLCAIPITHALDGTVIRFIKIRERMFLQFDYSDVFATRP